MDKVRALVAACKIKRATVPWVAGRSPDGKIVWKDVDVPDEVAGVNTDETLPYHELGEWLRQNEGENYDKDSNPPGTAHYDANGAEKIAVEERGGVWSQYCKGFRPIIKDVGDEGLDDLPPKAEYDLRPFQDDDRKLLEEILADEDDQQGQAEKASGDWQVVSLLPDAARATALKSTFAAPAGATTGVQGYDLEGATDKVSKVDAEYNPGPVEEEPCNQCSMFVRPDECKKVSGPINRDGHCKLFERGKAHKDRERTKYTGAGLLLGNFDDDNGKAAGGDKKTLYVHRPLTNADDLITWAKAQGFATTLLADDMHVTIAFSREPVDWSAAGGTFDTLIVQAAEDRAVEQLGDKGAIVLRFESPELAARWGAFKHEGAAWDYPEYRPHVTITYDAGDVELDNVKPYAGGLKFGPEEFA
jgi:hypothetical protein